MDFGDDILFGIFFFYVEKPNGVYTFENSLKK